MFDTGEDLLATHERQGMEPAIIAAFRALRAASADFDARLLPDEARKEKAAKVEATVHEIVGIVHAFKATAERQSENHLQQHDRAAAERATTGYVGVDLHRISIAKSGAELAVLLGEARAHSLDAARQAWRHIEPKLKELAASEQRRHVVGTGTTAFGVLCRLQGEMRDAVRGVPDRAALADAGRRRAQEFERRVLEVAEVVNLRRQIEVALRRASVPESAASTTGIKSGSWFDQFGSTRK